MIIQEYQDFHTQNIWKGSIDMDIRQLEAFVYTVKYQSFSQAAQKLYLSQPTVSAHIRSLEQEFHTQLLKRNNKNPVRNTGRHETLPICL